MISWWSGVISGIFFRRIMEDSGASEAGRCNKVGHMLIIAPLGDGGGCEEIHSTILSSFMYILKLPSDWVNFFFFLAMLCSLWEHTSLSGIKHEPLAVKAWSPNYWTIREFPTFFFLIFVEWMIQEGMFLLNTRLIFSKNNTSLKMDLRCSLKS